MFEETIAFLLNPPARLKALGAILSGGSVALIILGMYLRIGVIGVELIKGIAKVNVGDASLSSLYPGFPTWFIPESVPVFIFLIVIFCIGVYAQLIAKQFEQNNW